MANHQQLLRKWQRNMCVGCMGGGMGGGGSLVEVIPEVGDVSASWLV